jgi:hypothetical protein
VGLPASRRRHEDRIALSVASSARCTHQGPAARPVPCQNSHMVFSVPVRLLSDTR